MEIIKRVFTFIMDAIQGILIGASVFLVIYIFFFRPFEVSGESMSPTYKNGEYIITNLITLRYDDPRKGDVIVFQSPLEAEKDFIKRVIGTSGDTVMVQNGKVYVNGQMLDESAYLSPNVQTYGGAFLHDGQSRVVPENEFFVLGDNRSYSSDSREWGFLKREKLIGISSFVVLPFNKFRWITNPYPNK